MQYVNSTHLGHAPLLLDITTTKLAQPPVAVKKTSKGAVDPENVVGWPLAHVHLDFLVNVVLAGKLTPSRGDLDITVRFKGDVALCT